MVFKQLLARWPPNKLSWFQIAMFFTVQYLPRAMRSEMTKSFSLLVDTLWSIAGDLRVCRSHGINDLRSERCCNALVRVISQSSWKPELLAFTTCHLISLGRQFGLDIVKASTLSAGFVWLSRTAWKYMNGTKILQKVCCLMRFELNKQEFMNTDQIA